MADRNIEDELAAAQAEIARLKQQLTGRTSEDAAFRLILDASPVPQALNDDQHNVIYLNTAFTRTFGYELDDVPTLSDWWPKAYPDPEYRKAVISTWQKHLDESLRDNRPLETLQVRICCKDGTVKTIMAGASMLQGRFSGMHLVTLYDVSQLKAVESELNQTVALLENVVNSTPDLIAVKNRALQTLFCNEAYARAVGKKREDMYGKTDIENGWDPELVNGNTAEGIRGFIHDDLEAIAGKEIHNPYDPANVAGQTRIFDTHKLPLKDSRDNIIGMLLMARDVTERHQAESRLRESEARFRTIIESIDNIAVQGYDQHGRVTFWNPASTTLYGYTEQEALGKNLGDLILPEPMQAVFSQAIQQWVNSDVSIPAGEMLLKDKWDRPVPVYSSHTLQRTDDGHVELYCLDVSIAELRQTRQALEKVNAELDATLRAIPDLLFELDEDGRYINLWAHDEKLLAAERESLLGYTVAEKLPGEAATTVMQALRDAAKNGYSHGRIIALALPAGKHWFELSVSVKAETDGKKHFILLSRDITERINTEEQLRRSQKMDALGKLTGGIAHDFNNMLGVILGYGELLKSKLDDDSRLMHYVDQINMAGNRARTLTSKLLAFSRNQPAEKKVWNINSILAEDRHMLEKTLTAKVDLVFELSPSLWNVCINRDSFSDAILNMAINAMHAMPEGGSLVIKTENKVLSETSPHALPVSPGDYIQISLIDTGEGMTADIREKVFEPFFSTKQDKGTGLGLSQVYGFVKQSQGDIQIESEPGSGTRISIYLPRYNHEAEQTGQHSGTDRAQAAHSNETILIVDDETALRELSAEILAQNGYRVIGADNAIQALTVLETQAIDLMLTDVIMPGMNGYQLASRVRKLYPDVKIIITSGYNDEVGARDENRTNCQYLDKPYQAGKLLALVRETLG